MTRRAFITLFVSGLTVALLAPAPALADTREFSGRIDKVRKKRIVVDNRQGDKVSFVFNEDTKVRGRKTSIKKVKKGDWVTVSWKLEDVPRKAYKIVVHSIRKKDK